ncbi:MAG TPA: sortase [Jiangellaceae bacterium]|nr:sortase [Jiangellaceae bacterium]
MPERHRLTTRTACSYLLALLMLGGCAIADASDMSAQPTGTASATPSLTPHSNLSTYRSIRTHSETAPPVRLRIPAIDVDTRLVQLGLNDDKSINVNFDLSVAGWWKGGPRPGQVGPAVIMGHVRWNAPAVFSRLHSLQPGDEILVDRADGTTARFVVTRQGKYKKVAFPSDLVYYPTFDPELRLVTCGGLISGQYSENLVVFAAQAS